MRSVTSLIASSLAKFLHVATKSISATVSSTSVLSIVTMYLTFSIGIPHKGDFMLGLAAASPDWLSLTPMGVAVRALNSRDRKVQDLSTAWALYSGDL